MCSVFFICFPRPSVLDSFALLSGQLNTLNKVLKHEKTPLLRNQVIIPLVLSPDRDEEIMVRNVPMSVELIGVLRCAYGPTSVCYSCAWHSSALGVKKYKVMSSSALELLCSGAFTFQSLLWIYFTECALHKYCIFIKSGTKEMVS